MNIRQLEILRAVIDAGSASRAAQALGLSQPAVSRNMQQLEADLGLRLFDRTRGRLAPTAEARRIHEEIEKAFDGIERAVANARDIGQLTAGCLRVAAIPSLSQGLVRRALGRFVAKTPGVKVTFEVRSNRTVIDLVASRTVEMGIGTLPVSHPGIHTELLCQVGACCVLPREHPLAEAPIIRAEMLDGVDFIGLSRRHQSRHRLDEIFQAGAVRPRIQVEVATAETACAMAAESLGATVVNAVSARCYRHCDAVHVRPFSPDLSYDFGLMYPVKQAPSEATQAFSDFLSQYVEGTDWSVAAQPT